MRSIVLPSLRATARELSLFSAMVWITSSHPSVSNAQSIAATAASGA